MAVSNLEQRTGRFISFSHSEILAQAKVSNAVVIPPLIAGQSVTAKVIAATNRAKMDYTISTDAKVIAGTADWTTLATAALGTSVGTVTGPITGVRCTTFTAASVNSTFEVLVG